MLATTYPGGPLAIITALLWLLLTVAALISTPLAFFGASGRAGTVKLSQRVSRYLSLDYRVIQRPFSYPNIFLPLKNIESTPTPPA
jgi:hypothetical protein